MPAGTGSVAHALFVSKDRRIPKIRIQTRQLENLLDMRIVVAVDSWDCLSRYPSGHYVRTIGEIGDRDTETEVCSSGSITCVCFSYVIFSSQTKIINDHTVLGTRAMKFRWKQPDLPSFILQVVLIENDINSRAFSSQILACLPPLPWSVSSEDFSNPIRQDLRHLCVFSVDPPGMPSDIVLGGILFVISNYSRHTLFLACVGCKDIDDALHCTPLPNGNFEVGVRIL